MPMSKVSIIIPVYNAKDYLERCLDSVCNQTLKDIEIICINDCSTDNSLEILKRYALKDSRITIIDCEINGGESKARNLGLERATGEYIAFVDNDDTVDLDFYEKLYNKAKTGDFDISKGQAKAFRYDNTIEIFPNDDKIEKYGKHYFTSCWWSAIYKKELIIDNNMRLPENYPLGGDMLFIANAVIYAKNICLTEGTFYNHIMREDSGDSKVLSERKVISAVNIFNMICDNLNDAFRNNLIKDYEYDYLYYNYSIAVRYVFYKSPNYELKTICLKSITDNYNKCIRKENVIETYIKNDFEEIAFILKFKPDEIIKFGFADKKTKLLIKLRAKAHFNVNRKLPSE